MDMSENVGLPITEMSPDEGAGEPFGASAEPADGSENVGSFSEEDVRFMKRAMELAAVAESLDEVPVGAVAVRNGEIIAEGYNTRETERCATHHAEMIAIERACRALGGWRLPGVTLYVTMEPCAMCAGAVVNARIPRVVFGAPDLRFGAFGSLFNLSRMAVNHRPRVEGGLLAEENREMLSAYFKKKRKKR